MKLESLCAFSVAALVMPAIAMAEDVKAPEHEYTLSTNVIFAGLGLFNVTVEGKMGTHYASDFSVVYGKPTVSDDDLVVSGYMGGGKWYLGENHSGLMGGWRVASIQASDGGGSQLSIIGPGAYGGYRFGGEEGGWTTSLDLGGIYNLLGDSSQTAAPFAEILVGYRF